MIQRLKTYFLSCINGIMLSAGFMDFLDNWLRIGSVALGLILTLYLIRKAKEDIAGRKLDNQLKRLQIEREEQDLYERRLKNISK